MILDCTRTICLPRGLRAIALVTLFFLSQHEESIFVSAWSMKFSNAKTMEHTTHNPLYLQSSHKALQPLLSVRNDSYLKNPRLMNRPTLSSTTTTTALFVSSGFSFEDGEQVLVSVQKPLGIILEQDEEDEKNDSNNDEETNVKTKTNRAIIVAEVDPNGSAGRAGIMVGDILVAVQNASVEHQSLEYAMDFLARAPKVVNLRFIRQP